MYKANCSACSVAESVSEKGKARPRQKNRDFSKINARFSSAFSFQIRLKQLLRLPILGKTFLAFPCGFDSPARYRL